MWCSVFVQEGRYESGLSVEGICIQMQQMRAWGFMENFFKIRDLLDKKKHPVIVKFLILMGQLAIMIGLIYLSVVYKEFFEYFRVKI